MLARIKREPSLDTETVLSNYSTYTCRICLKPGEIAIFYKHNILNNIVEFGSITISEQDNFPKYLCEDCHLLLEAAVLFRQTAKKTEELLRSTISHSHIENNDSPNYLQVDNELLDNKHNHVDMQSEYQSSVFVKTQSESEHSIEPLKTETFLSDDESSVDDTKTEKEYLVVSESDEKNNYNIDINKCDVYMMILTDEEDKDKEPQFTCDVCFMNFKTIGKLENHVELEHNIKKTEKVNCAVCNEVVSKVFYNLHMKLHKEKYYELKEKKKKKTCKIECKICNKIVNKTYYKYHLKMHGTENERAEMTKPCIICGKYISTNYYNDHMKRVHKVGPYGEKLEEESDRRQHKHVQCPVCDKNIRENKYKDHLSQHGKPPKKYICEHCAKVFIHQSAFKTHCLTHGGEMKYKCQFCPYKAQYLGLLKIHVRTHTGEYNYKCTMCPARFLSKSNLNQHIVRHSGPGNIKCYDCDKTFYRKRNMEEHYKTIHLGIKDVICDTCGKGFSHRDRMLSHQLKVHKRDRLVPRVPTYLKVANEGKNS